MKGLRHTLLATGLVLLAFPALAWEWHYGPPLSLDDGFRRVHPVPSCGASFPNPGYIAIGTQDIGGPNPDVYVVYTDINGNSAAGWESTYDVEGLGLQDDGMAIVSVPNKGYVFLSNSLNGVWRPALTFIDCKGTVVWSYIYPDPFGFDLWGNDLIRTQSGDPAFGTAAGDYAVAGWSQNGANQDAFLMRTDANGILGLLNIAYNNQNLNEVFNALTEAAPAAPGLAGDLVAVGRLITTANDSQALIARVNGNNGAIGAFPQCIQHHGAAGSNEVYNSVTPLQAVFAGQFAMVGNTRGAAWQDDIWVTRGNTCPLTAQARFGDPFGQVTNEHGNDIIEVLVPKAGAGAGSLAIAGDHQQQPGAPVKAALMLLNPVLNPIPVQSWLFGAFNPDQETFYSLEEDPAGWPIPLGYIFSGQVRSPMTGDPLDLYLVHDDPGFVNSCEQSWTPTRVATSWPQVNLQPTRRQPARYIRVPTPQWYQITGIQTCSP